MENINKKSHTASIIISILAIVAMILPISSGISATSFDMQHSYNIFSILGMIFSGHAITEGAAAPFAASVYISAGLLVLVFLALIAMVILTLKKVHVGIRRVLAVVIMLTAILSGLCFNMNLTSSAKTGNNFYGISPEFKMVIKTPTGSVNSWAKKIDKLNKEAEEVFVNGEDINAIQAQLTALSEKANSIDYTATDSTKKKYNAEIFNELQAMIPVEQQQAVFADYFKQLTKSVTAVSSTFGIGYFLLIVLSIALCGVNYGERNANGFKSSGIYVNCIFAGLATTAAVGTLLLPVATVTNEATTATGLTQVPFIMALLNLSKVLAMQNGTRLALAAVLLVASLIVTVVFIVKCARKESFIFRRVLISVATALYILTAIIAAGAMKGTGVSIAIYFWLFAVVMISTTCASFAAVSDQERFTVFSMVNVVIFMFVCAIIIVPMWKVIVDSFDATAGYGMKMWPDSFSLVGYTTILTNPTMYRPFLISVITTIAGTLLGLTLSTLGAYVLIQFEMPGRNFLANMLLFTMIFQGGMIPTYLVMCDLGIINTLWAVILPLGINVYNLVLMRNFFEGIPQSLFESAALDGCTPMGTFIKIVLPLSKAALASIGLMFAVTFWNDYTNFKLYISNNNLYNFQMKLRAMIFSSDMPNNLSVSENTLQNAAIMVAIIPFMIIYPFCQQYFVKGVNIGAVKE